MERLLNGARRFPKPQPARAFAEYKRFHGEDPLRRPREDWEGARQRVAADPEWGKWLEQRRQEIAEWMEKRRDRVEWVAGWWHDFVSPKDGSYLTWTPDEPGRETLSSPSDPKVTLTPKLHAAWVYRFRITHGEKIADAARLFRLTEEARYAEWAAAQLDFYADNFEKWPLQKRGQGIWQSAARLFFQPLDEAVNLIRHISAAQTLGDFVTPERKRRWRDGLFGPQAEILEASFQSIHNIACWQRSAVGHVALYYDDPKLWQKAIDAPFGIRSQLAEGVTGDYLWYEQSLGYNSYVVQALLPLFQYAGLKGRGEALRDEMLIAENLMLAPLALRFPDGWLPSPADGSRVRATNVGLFVSAYRVFPTTLGLAEAAARKTWDTLIDPPEKASGPVSLALPTSRSLESSRMALLVKDGWQVFFHYGQLLQSHAQAEALHFEAYKGNVDITHDTGTVGYGSPLHRDYYTKGLAHNVPLVNGQGQQGWNQGELLHFDAAAGVVAAAQRAYRPDASAERTLQIDGDRLIDKVRITATTAAGGSPRLGLALHLQGPVRLSDAFTPDAAFAGGDRPAAFGYWHDPRSAAFRDRASFAVDFPDHPMRVTFLVAGDFRVTHASTPDAPPRRRAGLYLEVAGTEAVFTTVFEPLRP